MWQRGQKHGRHIETASSTKSFLGADVTQSKPCCVWAQAAAASVSRQTHSWGSDQWQPQMCQRCPLLAGPGSKTLSTQRKPNVSQGRPWEWDRVGVKVSSLCWLPAPCSSQPGLCASRVLQTFPILLSVSRGPSQTIKTVTALDSSKDTLEARPSQN